MSKLYNQLSKNDECYTPAYGVEPLLKYLKPNSVIWCPFDTDKSEYARAFRNAGHKVITSHIANNQDFLTYEPEEHYDMIISNPPFTNKRVWVERAVKLGKPFAFLLPATWLNDTAPFMLDVDLDILMFDKRISFGKSGISFKAIYFSWGILDRPYIIEKLNKPKPKEEIKSKMWEDFDYIGQKLDSIKC